MKDSIPILVCFIAACTSLVAQTPQLKYYPVGTTGYSSLFPVNPGPAEHSLSDNELDVYSSEVESNGDRYGLVLVLLEDHFVNSDKETLEALLVSYMEFMKLSYDITSGIGYIKQQKLVSEPRASGILDFWEDQDGAQWAVKGWIAHDALAVLYVKSNKAEDIPVPFDFLDGFVFKAQAKQAEMVKHAPAKGKMR